MMENDDIDQISVEPGRDAIDESEDYDEDSNDESDVQLGFVDKDDRNTLFKDPDWRNWDGGVVGGRPIWLNPATLPEPKSLQCTKCCDPLKFLLQIYCPIDEVPGAFHRALYLFCCKNRKCLNSGSVKCLRVQLPRLNSYYCYEPADIRAAPADTIERPTLCALCGCQGALLCSQCKAAHYCSKVHQKEHWKCHKLQCALTNKEGTSSAALQEQVRSAEKQVRARHLFPELSLVVEPEVIEGQDEQELKAIMEKANIWEDAVTEGGADEAADAKLTQADYQKALGSEAHDPTYINFLTRLERGGGDQVLRYCRTPSATAAAAAAAVSAASVPTTSSSAESESESASNLKNNVTSNNSSGGRSTQGLLLLSSNPQLLKDRAAAIQSNPCPRCGAPRTFECQVMPQLLHFLKVDQHTRLATEAPAAAPPAVSQTQGEEEGGQVKTPPPVATLPPEKAFFNVSDKDIDWGSLDVFTCSASCDAAPIPPTATSASAAPGGGMHGSCAYMEELVLIQPPVYHNK